MKLRDVLQLTGPLDDATTENAARDRFRTYLSTSILSVGAARDHIQECLETSGPQQNRALQDLVNRVAELIGFRVDYGRYSGVQNRIGFDGVWRRPELTIVAEVKTTDAYAIKTATLLNYINELVSAKRLANADSALGLFVVARLDSELRQLENSILAEQHTQRLRVMTVEALLSLAELVEDSFLSIDEAIAFLRPSAVLVDDTVRVLSRIAATAPEAESGGTDEGTPAPRPGVTGRTGDDVLHLMTPVSDSERGSIKEILESLLEKGWYVFGDRTPRRADLKAGDRLCFYGTTRGVVAQAEVASAPERGSVEGVYDPNRFPWRFRVTNVRFFFDEPIVIDAGLRSRLDVFRDRDPGRSWAWFVQSTREVTAHDFAVLTGAADPESSEQSSS